MKIIKTDTMTDILKYMKKRGSCYLPCILSGISFNLYFIFLMKDSNVAYLLYLDFLLGVVLLFFGAVDFCKFRKMQVQREGLMQQGEIICRLLAEFENQDIAEHDVQILEGKLQKQFDESCELQDYVAKWCHELKIPLASELLLVEKIWDVSLKKTMREQLEKMNQQLNAMLLGCKLQSPLFDLQIRQVSLRECVTTSVKNNQFFLIQKGFELDIRVGQLTVYTDPSWLVYILDQLLNNAVKYTMESPKLNIWSETKERTVLLFVEDHGEGIRSSDIRRIFEKGYTGSNYHNGKYKSTGMGLYMVSKIIARLGHEISVESEYGSYTRFCIIFHLNEYFQC